MGESNMGQFLLFFFFNSLYSFSSSFPFCLYTVIPPLPGFMLVGCDQKDPLSHLGTALHYTSLPVKYIPTFSTHHTPLLFYFFLWFELVIVLSRLRSSVGLNIFFPRVNLILQS